MPCRFCTPLQGAPCSKPPHQALRLRRTMASPLAEHEGAMVEWYECALCGGWAYRATPFAPGPRRWALDRPAAAGPGA